MYEDDYDELDAYDEFDLFGAEEELDDMEMEMAMEADDFDEMEELMEAALLAESDEEEDEFLGALISAATRVLPKVVSIGRKVLPALTGAAKRVVRAARKDPNLRRAARAGVNVLTRTARDVARQYARGRPVTPRYVTRRAARYTARALPYAVYGRRGFPAWSRRRPVPRPRYPRPPRTSSRRRLCYC